MFNLKQIYLLAMICNSGFVFADRFPHISQWHSTVSPLELVCGENNIEGDIFGDNPNLSIRMMSVSKRVFKRIYFTNCRFPKIPSNFNFKLYENLNTLDFSDVGLETLEMAALSNAKSVKIVIAARNRLTDISPEFFTDILQIEELDVSKNAIQSLGPSALSSAKNLLALDISRNKLATIDENAFDGAIKLKKLDISNNPIGSLKPELFARLAHLEVVSLKQTEITSIQPGTFSQQPNLISLDISENKLKELNFNQVFAPALHEFQSLNLSKNQLNNLNGCRNAIVPKLKVLDIRSNDFDCSYLLNLMEGLNAEVFELPIDRHLTDVQKANVRGINCKVTNTEKATQPTVVEGTQQSIDKLECDILFIKYALITIFLCTIVFFALRMILYRYARLSIISRREVDIQTNGISGHFVDYKNEKFDQNLNKHTA